MYEYVKRSEYQPVRLELEEIIQKVHRYMKKEFGITFQHKLIGSGKRHLITRIKGGNKGFDFDYNFLLPCPSEKSTYNAKALKLYFIEALKNALEGTKYSNPQDSTSAITIKVADKLKSSVLHSCDFAIIYYPEDSNSDSYYYIKNYKSQKCYSFEQRALPHCTDENLKYILGSSDGWNKIREEYIKLKNRNSDNNKRSFDLYTEAINNVFNQMTRFILVRDNNGLPI